MSTKLTHDLLSQKLATLQAQFNPQYQHIADHSVWTRQHAIHTEIQRLEKLAESLKPDITIASLSSAVSYDLMTRIVNDLVRIEDIVGGHHVFGGITESEKQAVKEAVELGVDNNFEPADAIESLLEYFRSHLAEIGPIMPVTGMNQPAIKSPAQNTAPGTQTNRPATPVDQAANVAIQLKSLNPAELEKNISTVMQKDPTLTKDINKSFATVLSNMIKNRV